MCINISEISWGCLEIARFGSQAAPVVSETGQEEALRAVQLSLLFVAVMLWLGVQAAQTETTGPDNGNSTALAAIADEAR